MREPLRLIRNLAAGVRLTAFLPVQVGHFAPSARQVVWLAAVALGVRIAADRLSVEGPVEFYGYSLHLLLSFGAIATAVLVLIAPRVEFLTAVAAASPFLVLLRLLEERVAIVFCAVVLYRAQRLAWEPAWLAAGKAAVALGLLLWVSVRVLDGPPRLWYPQPEEVVAEPPSASSASSASSAADEERAWFRQPELVDDALALVAPGERGAVDTFFVGFAGYGEQRVFDKEVHFARDALARRLPIEGRSLLLVNTREPDGDTPFASLTALRRVLAGVARRMNLDEDFLVLFLTSHGREDAELSVSQGDLPLDDLRGAELRGALDDAGIRWRVIVISACHSASFIPHLENPYTLVATASRADRKSLGCSDDRELTYFGEALFRDALPESADLIDALARAREVVERHEREENVAAAERSEPQVFVGERMRAKLAELAFTAP